MLPLQFFGQNFHFAISLFAALVLFAVFWLEFDAWLQKRDTKDLFKWLGFLLLALSFVTSSTTIEQSVLGESTIGNFSGTVTLVLQILGYISIIVGQIRDPLQKAPVLTGLDESEFEKPTVTTKPDNLRSAGLNKPKVQKLQSVGLGSLASSTHLLLPLGSLAVALLYFRRATVGLERHYKPVAVSFGLLSIYNLLSLSSLWQTSSNPMIIRLVAAFGPLWIITQLVLLVSVVILGRWVWKYLTRRFLSQLFMIFTSLTLAIFVLTTVSFTYLLMHNIQNSTLDNLQTASSVLSYAIDGKKAETIANAQSIAENSAIASAVSAKDNKALAVLTTSFLHDKKLSSLIITSDTGQVLLRAEDPTQFGDSMSSDTMIRRALIGTSSSTVNSRDGVLAPQIYIKATVPIRDSQGIVGTATAGLIADNAFTDGIKASTGLDSAIYAGNVRSATTFVAPDGNTRWIGVKETNSNVLNQVLKVHQTFKGELAVQNRQYLAVYTPLKDVDNTVVGMLFIGQPQTALLKAAAHSIELTFVVTAILLILSIVPAYLMSRYLAHQLE